MCLYDKLERAHLVWPSMGPEEFVDDLAQDGQGDEDHLYEKLGDACVHVGTSLTELFKISTKSALLPRSFHLPDRKSASLAAAYTCESYVRRCHSPFGVFHGVDGSRCVFSMIGLYDGLRHFSSSASFA